MKYFASKSNKIVVFDKKGAAIDSFFATNKHDRGCGKHVITKIQYESYNYTESTEAAISSRENGESWNDDDIYNPHSVYLMSLFGGNKAVDDDGAVRCCGADSRSPRSSMKQLEKALDAPYFWH
ncbi:hypothetical protein FRACYDRAFT_240918 [Fragilariopsis cylindrus CCMP1102]|uniref:Uncharacterized protein n=1 Tax=Fragilariopsis cylindrus CCMP1102 TaxID=635003 RepID=A0A1E7F866_9STRA|nr:hypothetical protein FRACYDRAFT_240918 [Fragilariopsis cylindrus CCMP1102]|eukprot:OEU14378.1 hypothetical protein FRACYDRAFT_240918 [Fragilariopsis cylindrus CCMP1102]